MRPSSRPGPRGSLPRPAVLVTGASKGIGAACVDRLVEDGFHVFAGVRGEPDAAALVERHERHVVPVLLDVTNPEHATSAAATIDVYAGDAGLAGLVNNAGIAIAGPLEFLPLDELRRQLDVNVVAQVGVTQAMLPLLRRARQARADDSRAGRIVFMSSVSGRNALPFTGAYGASKFALEAVADAMRLELEPWGIRVVIVEPGMIATPIWDTSAAVADRIMERMPPQLDEYYGTLLDAVRRRAQRGNSGLPPARVADAVSDALLAARPRIRYVVGRDARSRILMERWLPAGLRDRVILRALRRMRTTTDGTGTGTR